MQTPTGILIDSDAFVAVRIRNRGIPGHARPFVLRQHSVAVAVVLGDQLPGIIQDSRIDRVPSRFRRGQRLFCEDRPRPGNEKGIPVAKPTAAMTGWSLIDDTTHLSSGFKTIAWLVIVPCDSQSVCGTGEPFRNSRESTFYCCGVVPAFASGSGSLSSRIVWSWPAERAVRPSGEKATVSTGAVGPSKQPKTSPVATSRSRTP